MAPGAQATGLPVVRGGATLFQPAPRLEAWPGRLVAFIDERRAMPFAWGSNDCCLFAADAVAAITGVDAARKWRGYKTARGAASRIREARGIARLVETAAARHGWPEIAPAFARRGDVVLIEGDRPVINRRALGIVGPGGGLLLPGDDGLVTLPRAAAVRAWRIGSSAIALAKAG